MDKNLKLAKKMARPRKTAVLVIDMQNDFCHPNNIFKANVKDNRDCASKIYKFAEEAKKLGVDVLFSQQIFDAAKMTDRQKRYYSNLVSGKSETFGAYKGKFKIPCKKGTFGAKYYNFNPPKDKLFVKNNFDIWQNKKFIKYLNKHKIDTLVITGVEILCCVLFAVIGAEERGFKTMIVKDLVSGNVEWKKESDAMLSMLGKLYCPIISSEKIIASWKS